MSATGNNVQVSGPGRTVLDVDRREQRVGELVLADHVMQVTTTTVRHVVVRGRGPNRALGAARGRVDTGRLDIEELDVVSEDTEVRYLRSRPVGGSAPDIDDAWGRKR